MVAGIASLSPPTSYVVILLHTGEEGRRNSAIPQKIKSFKIFFEHIETIRESWS
jgi:hypothetical protein